MKKKHRCLVKRFAALVAALILVFSLSVPVFAASDTEADMPSLDDFYSHHGSWYVWLFYYISGFVLPLTFSLIGVCVRPKDLRKKFSR